MSQETTQQEKNGLCARTKKVKEIHGLLVSFFYLLFSCLRYVSVFQWIREANKCRCKRKKIDVANSFIGGYHFPDIWVSINIIFEIAIYLLIFYTEGSHLWFCWIFVVLAIMRALEIMVYHVNVLLFDPISSKIEGKRYHIKSPIRMLILLLINMAEYILCFGIVYLFFYYEDVTADGYWNSFTLSIYSFLNISLKEEEDIIHLVRIESILGIFMNLICIARFINMLPAVSSLDQQDEDDTKRQYNID